jgi:hypothetical protein
VDRRQGREALREALNRERLATVVPVVFLILPVTVVLALLRRQGSPCHVLVTHGVAGKPT